VAGTYANLFEGVVENVVQCVNTDFESIRTEKFNCLSLNVKNVSSIEDSILRYVSPDWLMGND
jgi:ubiquitin carboxyl-terminal hydrolase 7